MTDGIWFQVVFISIDEEICFNENLIISAVDSGIGVVMADEIGDTIYQGSGAVEFFQYGPGDGRPF